jgi:hypothetical protein
VDPADGATTASYPDDGVTAADTTPYFYSVTATPALGSPNESVDLSTAPAAPVLAVKAGAVPATELVLSWTSTNATSFALERGTVEAGPFAAVNTQTSAAGAPAAMTFTDTGLTTGTKYFYRLKATSISGSKSSAVVSATPKAP